MKSCSQLLALVALIVCGACDNNAKSSKNFFELKIGKLRINLEGQENFSVKKSSGIDSQNYSILLDNCGGMTINIDRLAFDFISNYEAQGFEAQSTFLYKNAENEVLIFEENNVKQKAGAISKLTVASEESNCATSWIFSNISIGE